MTGESIEEDDMVKSMAIALYRERRTDEEEGGLQARVRDKISLIRSRVLPLEIRLITIYYNKRDR
jgi:hypothetical protein